MWGDPALADIDCPVGEQRTQMGVGSALPPPYPRGKAGDVADDVVGTERRDGHRPSRSFKDDVGLALDDQIGGIGRITLMAEKLAIVEADPLAHERHELELGRFDLRKSRHPTEKLEFLLQ